MVEETEPRLDWTYQPHRQARAMRHILTEGNMRCLVTTPAAEAGERQHQPHLMRMTRIEPGTPCAKPPIIPGQRGCEQITVTEKDLRRCGNNLKLLRECHQRQAQRAQETQSSELALSFKMAFAKRCRSDVDLRDPWKDMKNPEETREKRESDLILNQVWIMPPKKLSFEGSAAAKDISESPPSAHRSMSGSTRASSVDLPFSGRVRRQSRGAGLQRAGTMEVSRSESRSRPTSGTKSRTSSKNSADRPDPGPKVQISPAPAPTPAKDSKVKNRIQPLESPRTMEDDPEDDSTGSVLVREATRMQRHFTHKIDESRHCGSGSYCAWMALDRNTGEVHLYPKEAASRVEVAHRHGRTSVPLAGVGEPFEGIIVQLSGTGEESKPIERSWDGDVRDVRRLEVQLFMTDAVMHVVQQEDGEWHFADTPIPGVTQERFVRLSRNEVVAPPSPTLPPVNPDRRPQCFLNPGADWAP